MERTIKKGKPLTLEKIEKILRTVMCPNSNDLNEKRGNQNIYMCSLSKTI